MKSLTAGEAAVEEATRAPIRVPRERRLSLLALVSVIFFTVSGGAYGLEPVVGAVGAGVLVQAGTDYRAVYLVLLVPLGLLLLAFANTRFPTGERGDPGGDNRWARYALYRHLPLLLVGGIATLGLGSEGEMEHWSGIYLRDKDGKNPKPLTGANVGYREVLHVDAKAGDKLPKDQKGDASSRLQGSEGPAEDEEKREVVEKLRKREGDS